MYGKLLGEKETPKYQPTAGICLFWDEQVLRFIIGTEKDIWVLSSRFTRGNAFCWSAFISSPLLSEHQWNVHTLYLTVDTHMMPFKYANKTSWWQNIYVGAQLRARSWGGWLTKLPTPQTLGIVSWSYFWLSTIFTLAMISYPRTIDRGGPEPIGNQSIRYVHIWGSSLMYKATRVVSESDITSVITYSSKIYYCMGCSNYS